MLYAYIKEQITGNSRGKTPVRQGRCQIQKAPAVPIRQRFQLLIQFLYIDVADLILFPLLQHIGYTDNMYTSSRRPRLDLVGQLLIVHAGIVRYIQVVQPQGG